MKLVHQEVEHLIRECDSQGRQDTAGRIVTEPHWGDGPATTEVLTSIGAYVEQHFSVNKGSN